MSTLSAHLKKLLRILILIVCIGVCVQTQMFAVVYYWRTAAPNNVWTNVNNWSTVGFGGGPAAAFPGPADVATFGLLAQTPNNITFTGIPLAGVGAINATTFQRTITIPAGETLNIVGTGSDAGGNATIQVLTGGMLRILGGANITGAGGAWRWQMSGGTLEIVDNGAVLNSGIGFSPGSTLRYTGSMPKTAGAEFIDGNTGTLYAGGFPANVVVNRAVGSNLVLPNNVVIAGSTTLMSGWVNDGGAYNVTFNGNVSINVIKLSPSSSYEAVLRVYL